MPFQIFNETGFLNFAQTWTDADGDSEFTMYSGDYSYKRIDSILVTNEDTDDHIVQVFHQRSGQPYTMCSVNVPAGSGTGGVPPVDIVAAQMPINLGGFVVQTYDDVHWRVEGTINTGKLVHAYAFVGTI